jgi:hypothetical protein
VGIFIESLAGFGEFGFMGNLRGLVFEFVGEVGKMI